MVVLESGTWFQVLPIPFRLCGFGGFFGMCLNPSEPQFSYLKNGHNDISLRVDIMTSPSEKFLKISEITPVMVVIMT